MWKSRSKRRSCGRYHTDHRLGSGAYAEEVAARVATALSERRPTKIFLDASTLDGEPNDASKGYLAIVFFRNKESVHSIGIEFGRPPRRQPPCGWRSEAKGCAEDVNAAIAALDFEEAWEIVRLVVHRLRIRQVSLMYQY